MVPVTMQKWYREYLLLPSCSYDLYIIIYIIIRI